MSWLGWVEDELLLEHIAVRRLDIPCCKACSGSSNSSSSLPLTILYIIIISLCEYYSQANQIRSLLLARTLFCDLLLQYHCSCGS